MSTPEYYMLRLFGIIADEKRKSRERWEIARYMATRARTAFAEKFPRGFWEFPWDDDKESLSLDEWDEFNRMMDERYPTRLDVN